MDIEEQRPDADTPAIETPADGSAASAAEKAPPWKPNPPHVHRYDDSAAMFESAAKHFLDSAKRAVDQHGRFLVVLAGGSTPRGLYAALTESPYREKVPWDKTFFVFGDERCVPPDNEASNYRMVNEALFEPLEIAQWRVMRVKGERKPVEAARLYEVRMNDLFLGIQKRHFDLALLGIGSDGHTASLFPGTEALAEESRWAVANHVPQQDEWRVTLTFPALSSARRVMFLATGDEKAQVLAEAFGGLDHPEPHPCERVLPRGGRRDVLLDVAAASRMPAFANKPPKSKSAKNKTAPDTES